MAISFSKLRELRSHHLPFSTALVLAFLKEFGQHPVGIIAEACDLSERSVERSLASLKRLNLVPTNLSHDHDHGDHGVKGTATNLSGESTATDTSDGDKPVDPIREKLLEYEILPWCVDSLMAKADRKAIERQLEYHAFRLARGFKFSKHPATYLYSACLRDFVAPDGFHAAAHKARAGIKDAPKVVQISARPEPQPEVPLNDTQKLDTLRKLQAQLYPAAKRMAAKLAMDWGMNLEDLASAAG